MAISLSHELEPPLNSLVDQSCMNNKMLENNNNFTELDNICCNSALADCTDVKPATFITGPEACPAHLQLKVSIVLVVLHFRHKMGHFDF